MMKQNWKYNFFMIWVGQAISLITSATLQMAIIWHLTEQTGSAMILSIATMVGFLPQAIFGTMIGVLVDRWNRKYVMITADLLIAAAGAVLAVISFTRELPIWVIMLILFIRSVGTAFHTPALGAITPLLVPEDKLVKCAGYSQSVQSFSYVLSPAIAAFLYSIWNLNAVILLDILGAVTASSTVLFASIPNQKNQIKDIKSSFSLEMKEGYSVIKKEKSLIALLWIGAVFTFVYMPVNAMFPLMSMGYFKGTTTHASIAEIVFALGMLAGGLLLSVWGGFKNRAYSIVLSIATIGIALIIAGILPVNGFAVFVLCCIAMGFSSPFYNGVQIALFQEKIQPEFLGRVFGLLGSIMSLAMPLGLIVSGFFAEKIGVHYWFALSGVIIMVLSIVCFCLTSFREIDKEQRKK